MKMANFIRCYPNIKQLFDKSHIISSKHYNKSTTSEIPAYNIHYLFDGISLLHTGRDGKYE